MTPAVGPAEWNLSDKVLPSSDRLVAWPASQVREGIRPFPLIRSNQAIKMMQLERILQPAIPLSPLGDTGNRPQCQPDPQNHYESRKRLERIPAM